MDAEYQAIRDGILESIRCMRDDPEQLGLLLMGSLSQGVGNELSDIDVLAVDFSGQDYGMPVRQLTHVGQQRCEIYFASPADLKGLSERMQDEKLQMDSMPVAAQRELFVRIAFGKPLRNIPETEEAVATITPARASKMLCDFHDSVTSQLVADTVALQAVGATELAAGKARQALEHRLSAIINGQGDLLLTSVKYLEPMMAKLTQRQGEAGDLLALYKRYLPADPETYIAEAFAGLGIDDGQVDRLQASMTFHMAQDLRMADLVNSVSLMQGDRFYVANPAYCDAVRSVAGGPIALAGLDAMGRSAVRSLVEAKLGEIRLQDRPLAGLFPRLYPHEGVRWMSGGVIWPADCDEAVIRTNCSPEDIVDIFTAIFMAGITYANSQEDAVGAIRKHRWSEVEISLKRMAASLVAIGLAYNSVVIDIAIWNHFPQILRMVSRVPGLHAWIPEVRDMASRNISDARSATEMVQALERMRRMLPDTLMTELERSMADGEVHEEVIVRRGNILAQISREVHAEKFVREDRTAMSNGQRKFLELQQRASKNWSRADDLAQELAELA